MLYSYVIKGHRYGNVNDTEYTGLVEADKPLRAIIMAFSAEFGDTDKHKAGDLIGSISAWDDDCAAQLKEIMSDETDAWEYDSGTHTFTIEVEEAGEPMPVPGWIDQFISRIVMDTNVHAAKSGCKGFALVRTSTGPCPFHNSGSGNGEWGQIVTIRLKDLDTDEESDFKVVFNFSTGHAYLSNGYNRIGWLYPIRLGDRSGEYAD